MTWTGIGKTLDADIRHSSTGGGKDRAIPVAELNAPVSLRDLALLLALLLGAGAAMPGCGGEEVPAQTAPEPPSVPTPPTPTRTLTAPENLRVTGQGSDYIEWSWNAVAGALAYHAQFSMDDTFTTADATFLIVAPKTSYRVEELSDGATGHFRVRAAGAVSLTTLQFSEWSEAVMGATTASARAPLNVPQNVRATDPHEDSVALGWDPVSGAGSYEVEQREPDSDNEWGGADCEDADPGNLVEGEECIASGLEADTDYLFRVRAVPADTDQHRESSWSAAREARTAPAGPRPTEPTTGAMGNLNVQWTSDADGIMWTWDRLPGATYDYAVVTGGDLPRRGSAEPVRRRDLRAVGRGGHARGERRRSGSAALCPDEQSGRRLGEPLVCLGRDSPLRSVRPHGRRRLAGR